MARLTIKEHDFVRTALRDLIYQSIMYQELEKDDDELRVAIKSAEDALEIVKKAEFK